MDIWYIYVYIYIYMHVYDSLLHQEVWWHARNCFCWSGIRFLLEVIRESSYQRCKTYCTRFSTTHNHTWCIQMGLLCSVFLPAWASWTFPMVVCQIVVSKVQVPKPLAKWSCYLSIYTAIFVFFYVWNSILGWWGKQGLCFNVCCHRLWRVPNIFVTLVEVSRSFTFRWLAAQSSLQIQELSKAPRLVTRSSREWYTHVMTIISLVLDQTCFRQSAWTNLYEEQLVSNVIFGFSLLRSKLCENLLCR